MSEQNKFSRRSFIKWAGATGASAAFLGSSVSFWDAYAKNTQGQAYMLSDASCQIYSVCQQCNTQCGIKVKLADGIAVKVEGNPYSPWNMIPHVPYASPISEMGPVDAPLCPKGQAGIQAAYDPFRIKQVLKRAGKRGDNTWITIPFEQAVTEIVEGGKIFSHVQGEENRSVEGLRSLRAITDPELMREMQAAIGKIRAEKDLEQKKALVGKFKEDFAAHLDKMIDPDHPDFGPKNNEILYFWGRQKAGRGDFASRFFGAGLGTANRHGHTTVCQGSLYFAGKSMSDQWTGTAFSGGSKAYWMGDTASADFVLFVGASPFEANYGPTNRAPRIVDRLGKGHVKYAVIDPRLSKTAGKAWKWLANKPGSEGAIALGMIQWIIAQERYDSRYLSLANKAASTQAKEPTWSNAAWLVKIDPETGQPGKFLRGSDLNLVEAKEEGQGIVYQTLLSPKTPPYTVLPTQVTDYNFSLKPPVHFATDPFVVLDANGRPILFDPNDTERPVQAGLLFVHTQIGGIPVKSSLQLLKESAQEKTLDEWADISGLRVQDIEALAFEFTAHGKRACMDIHRGVSQHTNGYYNVLAWNALALLIGNYDWRGGQSWPSGYDISGGRADGPFVISKANPGALAPFGLSIIRHETNYEDSTIFMNLSPEQRYPAQRNWYPLASDIYQEILPSAADGYPYPIKAAFMYQGSPVYSLPGGNTWISMLSDVDKLPLFVASDIIVGETSMYADYIFPDVTYLERWEFSGSHASLTFRVQGTRQPVIAPLTGTVKVYGQEMAQQWEALLLALAERLDLPNFGPNGFGQGIDFTHPDDLYIRQVMNLAAGEKKNLEEAVPEASAEEIQIFIKARSHLPKAVFDLSRWQKISGDLWPRVVTVLARGGRFQAYEQGYPSDLQHRDLLGVKYGKLINLYLEKNSSIRYSGTGERIPSIACYIPSATAFEGKQIDDRQEGYDLTLITYREVSQTKSRTQGNYWLKALMPENFLLMNSVDAQQRGLRDGDQVHITSASNPQGEWDLGASGKQRIQGKVKVLEGIRPGVVAFALGFGHWAYGAHDLSINRKTIKGDPQRHAGFHANAVMRTDPSIPNTCLFDPVGGSAVFYDTQVRVKKV
jgi:tetrathionate reductase subunit A